MYSSSRSAAILVVCLGVFVLILLLIFHSRRESLPPANKNATQAKQVLSDGHGNPETPIPNGIVDQQIAEVIRNLLEAIRAHNRPLAVECEEKLLTFGESLVAPVRHELLSNSVAWTAYPQYCGILVRTLRKVASAKTSSNLFVAFSEVDAALFDLRDREADQLLFAFSEIIVLAPPKDVRPMVKAAYLESKRLLVRKALVRLMGMLLRQIPAFREDLAAIMEEAIESDLKAAAAHALAAANPEQSLPELTKALSRLLSQETMASAEEIKAIAGTLLKALPLEAALLLLDEYLSKAPNIDNVTALGMEIGFQFAYGNIPSLEPVYLRALVETDPKKLGLLLTAMATSSVRGQKDPRFPEVASYILDTTESSQVKSYALSTIVATSSSESSILDAIQHMKNIGGDEAKWAGVQVVQYYRAHPESTAVSDRLHEYVSTGDESLQLAIVRQLALGQVTLTAELRAIIAKLRDSTQNQKLQKAASKLLGN